MNGQTLFDQSKTNGSGLSDRKSGTFDCDLNVPVNGLNHLQGGTHRGYWKQRLGSWLGRGRPAPVKIVTWKNYGSWGDAAGTQFSTNVADPVPANFPVYPKFHKRRNDSGLWVTAAVDIWSEDADSVNSAFTYVSVEAMDGPRAHKFNNQLQVSIAVPPAQLVVVNLQGIIYSEAFSAGDYNIKIYCHMNRVDAPAKFMHWGFQWADMKVFEVLLPNQQL